jgi:quercetin dioxygenase-like cupin family protein
MLTPENTGRGPPGDLNVTHYIINKGGALTLEEPNVEYQDYIISGTALFGKSFLHANSTIFVPTNKKHTYINLGESDLRILSHTYSVPKPSHKWCKTRIAQLTFPNPQQQLMEEEYHALIGAQRFHALDVQDYEVGPGVNPEETAYFLSGEGRVLTGGKWYDVRPGTLAYVEEDMNHAIRRKDDKPFQYFVMEYTEQDKMWRKRGRS